KPSVRAATRPGESPADSQARCHQAAWDQFGKQLMRLKDYCKYRFQSYGTQPPDCVKSVELQGQLPWEERWRPFFSAKVIKSTPGRRLSPFEQGQLDELDLTWRREQETLAMKYKEQGETISELMLKPRREDIKILEFGLAWAPFWHTADGRLIHAYA